MPIASGRVLNIILEECKQREERFPEYRRELIETLSEIIQLERAHRVQGINIKQKITDKIQALGNLIAESRTDR